ncbi:hypothetical protein [Lysinibacillus parviboronicapiens]|uniref:hypothetical protein n=1 Tax=Lysinibacillus parviboronicapiens TaxID=436516 RepID=UPI001EE765C4|nr:hypothetical protein [Lysinibacillus parviboronicapiens]
MFEKVKYMLSIFSIIIMFFTFEDVYANSQLPTFEEKFTEGGYKSVEEAVKEFEIILIVK